MTTTPDSPLVIPPLLTLPVELIQEIGRRTWTPNDQLSFARMNKHIHSAIDIIELIKKDSDYQQKLALRKRWRRGKTIKYVYELFWRDGLHLFTFQEISCIQTEATYLIRPPLLTAILTGKDINYVKRCIALYQAYFPGGLQGKWYPKVYGHARDCIWTCFPSPIVAATRTGRLDIVQALLESGVNVNGRNDRESLSTALRILYHDWSAEDPFRVACRSKNEDIAKLLASRGLIYRRNDLLLVISSGFFETLESLLENPSINSRPDFQRILQWTIGQTNFSKLRLDERSNIRLIDRFLSLLTDPGFDRSNWILKELLAALEHRKSLLAMHLLNAYVESASPPFEADEILYQATGNDANLEITKTVLSGDPWIVKDPKCPQSALFFAVWHNRPATIRYMLSLGHKFCGAQLRSIIQANKHEMIDIVVDNMKDPVLTGEDLANASLYCLRFHGHGGKPSRVGHFTIFKALYLGADYTNIRRNVIDDFIDDLQWDEDLFQYHIKNGDVQTARPSRLSFAQQLPYRAIPREENPRRVKRFVTDTQAYVEQLHAAARMIIGDDYWEQLKKRHPYSPRRDGGSEDE
ncbi:hypothetical protein GGS26DRAFT_564980 [Hypomontagnella submonticulosa]|nr:hypothetical protein GGS26DRAFT_564980 [Hypomontagnella submonticulosa]